MEYGLKKLVAVMLSGITAFSAIGLSSGKTVNAAEKKVIALTFDDGPNTTTTNEVLDILEEYDAVASFFLIGDNISEESAASVKRAYDMGCEIDNHSKSHPTMSGMSAEEITAEVSYVDEKVFEITGEYPHFFRPPFIAVSDIMYETIDLPFICGLGCQDYMDNVTAEQRAETVLNGAKDGLIVLLHDAAGNYQTVDALKIIMPELKKEGYEFVTLTQLFEIQGETPRYDILYSEVAKYPCSSYTVHKNIFSGEVSGESGSAVWSNAAVFDGAELNKLGDSYAIEVAYNSAVPPVITLQRWSGEAVWSTIQPFYFNGNRACFMAEDIIKSLEELGVDYTDLDRISISPYGGEMTMTNVDILVKGTSNEDTVPGDVNADGVVNTADALLLQKWLLNTAGITLNNPLAGDLSNDNVLNIPDLCLMKEKLINTKPEISLIHVTNTEELKTALENAKAGDEIVLAEGEYIYTGSTPKGRMFTGSGEGLEDNPIIIRSENPEKPAVLAGTSTDSNYVLTITGDWWEIRDLKITNAQKGIMIDNSNHTKIIGCEVYNIGSEGIHFRDNSSYCLAENCYVHDTGVVSPGYGEAVYIGSAKSTTGYGFDCHYNTVRSCKLGPNVTAEHIDVKEYTIGTVIENCIFDGTGMSGENSSKSFVNIKGNDCILRNNIGYRNGCEKILRAFEQNQVVDGWGQNALVYGNKVYMDTPTGATGKKMYFLNSWDCSVTVWDNFMAYESDLFSVDNEDDHWEYYNCNIITYGDNSQQ